MKKNQIIGIIVIAILLTGGGAWYLKSVEKPAPVPLKNITIDPGKGVQPTLLLVARNQGYFTKHGLNVTFIESPSATVAMQNLLNRKFDIGYVNEYSLSEPALYNKKLRVIGMLSQSDTSFVVGRRDRGIIQISDLAGKKIGVTKGSIVEYFMNRFFILNSLSMSMSINKITIINLQLAQLVNATVNGDIDASFSFEPYVYQMRQQMGENAVVWPTNLGQHSYYSLVCNEITVKENPDIAEAVLASVLEAETYVESHPEEAKIIARKQINFDDQYMEQDWPNHHFSIGLSQSLITIMEDETRWRISNNMTDATAVPDFTEYISPDILYRLKPASVTIIR
ncbi:MAG: NrtA/SsuA/CpmA family ABC transporter substrate-binding protein [Methanoregula sp.]|nr:NrtA/SsuA/CpmA family ABC transporter substrate-binding protein [Methanoregula sp.]